MTVPTAIQNQFIEAATWFGSMDVAEDLLLLYPGLVSNSIYTAAILGDYEKVEFFLLVDPANATATTGPYGGNALVYLSLSKYLALKKRPLDDFIKCAEALMDAGADPNSGFWTTGDDPEFETALYGAAGFAHNASLTKLLLDRGADPNDIEAVYHSPETYDNGAMKLLVNTGKLTPENLVLMLIRKHDFHDQEGAKFLLNHGTDPNISSRPGGYPIHHALSRGNHLDMFKLLLDHGANPFVSDKKGQTAIVHAAWEGRGDVLKLFRDRGFDTNLQGVDKLIAACAEDNVDVVNTIIDNSPELVDEAKTTTGTLLTRFASNGNAAGIKQLLNVGLDVNAPFKEGDAYFGIPKKSMPIHVASWKNYPEVVKVLIEHGANINRPDANEDTPLMLAVKACVDSYWMYRRSPDAVKALLDAGASPANVPFPSGYAEVDELLNNFSKHS